MVVGFIYLNIERKLIYIGCLMIKKLFEIWVKKGKMICVCFLLFNICIIFFRIIVMVI